jgi:hypothetical protein
VRKPTIGKQGFSNRLLQRVSTRADADTVLFCTRMAEQPLTLRVVRRTVREAEVRWAGLQSCDSTDKTSRFKMALNPVSAVMQIDSEISPGNGLHPASGEQH